MSAMADEPLVKSKTLVIPPLGSVTIGADVEYLLMRGVNAVTAEGIIPGTKASPHRFSSNKHYGTSLDCVAAEINIPPVTTALSFEGALRFACNRVHKLAADAGAQIFFGAAGLMFSEAQLKSETARNFGCDPALNCWTLEPQFLAPPEECGPWRFAGFHVHVGYENPNEEMNVKIARLLDLFLGVGFMAMNGSNISWYSGLAERIHFGYGRAGSFRHQPHGVEYRVLPSLDPEYHKWIFASTIEALHLIDTPIMEHIFGVKDDICTAINGLHKDGAHVTQVRVRTLAHSYGTLDIQYKHFQPRRQEVRRDPDPNGRVGIIDPGNAELGAPVFVDEQPADPIRPRPAARLLDAGNVWRRQVAQVQGIVAADPPAVAGAEIVDEAGAAAAFNRIMDGIAERRRAAERNED